MRLPLGGVDDPRDHVERPRPIDAASIGVDGERDPHREDVEVGVVLACLQLVDAEPAQRFDQHLSMRPCGSVRHQQLVVGPRMDAQVGDCHCAPVSHAYRVRRCVSSV